LGATNNGKTFKKKSPSNYRARKGIDEISIHTVFEWRFRAKFASHAPSRLLKSRWGSRETDYWIQTDRQAGPVAGRGWRLADTAAPGFFEVASIMKPEL
jgi:hypothetical protein